MRMEWLGASSYITGVKSIQRQSKANTAQREYPRTTTFEAIPVSQKSLPPLKKAKPAMSRFIPAPLKPSKPLVEQSPTRYHEGDDAEDFVDPAGEEQEEEDDLEIVDQPAKTRNKDGTVIERIPMGPLQHKWRKSDPWFDEVEPNSGIRLKYVSCQLLPCSRYAKVADVDAMIIDLGRCRMKRCNHTSLRATFSLLNCSTLSFDPPKAEETSMFLL